MSTLHQPVAVVAGTLGDTNMGVALLEEAGYTTVAYPFSKTPDEQTAMQYFSKDELNAGFRSIVKDAKVKGASAVFIYCNSLSLSVDYKDVADEAGLPVITPLEVYDSIAERRLFIMAANGFSAYALDRRMSERLRPESVISLGIMPLVNAIERRQDAFTQNNLRGLIQYIEGLAPQPQAIVLGCTHFHAVAEDMARLTTLHVIDPTAAMMAALQAALA
ncbi:aspartate/glutamate racemase family protein [Peptoniphilus equinus]|uniref:Aspartate/glutamate racemase family protein n=1 Tax=Peptoniphilus equinus TaxID=3016343 RepID=A0ABY7QSX1_9FIRM|nr:aspartate/glutamate racemase family protein [Peptoniphilus equinus]WBW49877.1 aspartate/glutamate racemase family protein [Peptoniphilus equinus]